MIREMAAWAVHRLDSGLYARRRGSLPTQDLRTLERRLGWEGDQPPLLLFEKAKILRRSPIFGQVRPSDLVRLTAAITEVRLRPGELLFQAGDPGDNLYITVAGGIEIEVRGQVVGRSGPEELLGEIAAVETGVRTASAKAVEPSSLLAIERGTLHELIADHVEILPGIIQVIARRRRDPAKATPPAAPPALALAG